MHKLHLGSPLILFSCRFLCEAISQMSGLKELLVQHIDLDEITERSERWKEQSRREAERGEFIFTRTQGSHKAGADVILFFN